MEGCAFFFFFLETPQGRRWIPRSFILTAKGAPSEFSSAHNLAPILKSTGLSVTESLINNKLVYLTVEKRITVSLTPTEIEINYRTSAGTLDAEASKEVEKRLLFIAEQAILLLQNNQTQDLRIRSRYMSYHPDPDSLFRSRLFKDNVTQSEYGIMDSLGFSFSVKMMNHLLRVTMSSFPREDERRADPYVSVNFEQAFGRKSREEILSIFQRQEELSQHRFDIVRSFLGDEP